MAVNMKKMMLLSRMVNGNNKFCQSIFQALPLIQKPLQKQVFETIIAVALNNEEDVNEDVNMYEIISPIVSDAINMNFIINYLDEQNSVSISHFNPKVLYEWAKKYENLTNFSIIVGKLDPKNFSLKHHHVILDSSNGKKLQSLSTKKITKIFSALNSEDTENTGNIGHFGQLAIPPIKYFPKQIAQIYNFPTPSTANVVVGVVALGGAVDTNSIQQYWLNDCKIPSSNLPKVIIISTDGSNISPSQIGYELENTMDVEIIGACCASTNPNIISNVTIVVYHAQNSIQGFYSSFQYAINDTKYNPSAVSCSWGIPEDIYLGYGSSGAQLLQAFNSLFGSAVRKGINICTASGDLAASDGINDGKPHVDFPASSPNVVSCGGTTLYCPNFIYDMNTVETVWSFDIFDNDGAGGGVSSFFGKPTYQTNPIYKRRSIPDIVANSDPNTGLYVRFQGQLHIVGGTSVASPLVSSFIALCAIKKFINPIIYANPQAFHKIITGTNGVYSANSLEDYTPCSGIGSINGSKLWAVLKQLI